MKSQSMHNKSIEKLLMVKICCFFNFLKTRYLKAFIWFKTAFFYFMVSLWIGPLNINMDIFQEPDFQSCLRRDERRRLYFQTMILKVCQCSCCFLNIGKYTVYFLIFYQFSHNVFICRHIFFIWQRKLCKNIMSTFARHHFLLLHLFLRF